MQKVLRQGKIWTNLGREIKFTYKGNSALYIHPNMCSVAVLMVFFCCLRCIVQTMHNVTTYKGEAEMYPAQVFTGKRAHEPPPQ